jgi:hypothetical protein
MPACEQSRRGHRTETTAGTEVDKPATCFAWEICDSVIFLILFEAQLKTGIKGFVNC